MDNNDPIELPTELPTHSISILYAFARGKESWSTEVFRSILTIVGYVGVMAKIPVPIAGASASEIEMFEKAVDALSKPMDEKTDEMVIEILGGLNQGLSGALIPWGLILAWALHKLLDNILDKVKKS